MGLAIGGESPTETLLPNPSAPHPQLEFQSALTSLKYLCLPDLYTTLVDMKFTLGGATN